MTIAMKIKTDDVCDSIDRVMVRAHIRKIILRAMGLHPEKMAL